MDLIYNTIVLAGLLHDVGKYYQKGECRYFSTRNKHQLVSVDFIKTFESLFSKFTDINMLEELVKKHHENSKNFDSELLVQNSKKEYKPYAYIINCADNLSSKERDKHREEGSNYKTRPLASIFSSISINDNINDTIGYYRVGEFRPENCFPNQKLVQNIISKNTLLINKFTDEIELLTKSQINDFNTLYTLVNSLLLKYLWCIPSSSFDKVPDVSLYDHLKTTSAIAGCMYKYHKEKNEFTISSITDNNIPKFKLVLGDFSGIQDFIFGVSSIGAGGIAKRLRARSFYVNVLLEVISHYICDTFDVSLNNILISSGGKFYILLPNTSNSNKIINNIVKEVESFLYKESSAQISINIAVKDICGNEFDNFDKVIKKLHRILNTVKSQKYKSVIQNENGWNEDSFAIYDDLDGKTLCRCCKKNMVANTAEQRICSRCQTDAKLGQRLANAKYIYYGKDCSGINIFKNYYIQVDQKIIHGNWYLVNVINDCNVRTNQLKYELPISIKYIANHIPIYGEVQCNSDEDYNIGQPITFEDICKNSEKGKKLLGFYKADVDNLGFLFKEGFRKNLEEDKNSISRITTFSRMLEMFFSGYINSIIEQKYPYTYCVFSGGDDLFLIGPWSSTIDMAMDINKKFKEYTCYNPSFTLSAGIIIQHAKYPINKAAQDAEESLEQAKNIYEKKFYDEAKNQITFLNKTMKWSDFEDIIIQGKMMEELIDNDLINVLHVRRLLRYNQMYNDFIRERSIKSLSFIPMLTYDIARNYNSSKIPNKFREWVLNLRNEIDKNKYLHYLDVVGQYALMKTRE